MCISMVVKHLGDSGSECRLLINSVCTYYPERLTSASACCLVLAQDWAHGESYDWRTEGWGSHGPTQPNHFLLTTPSVLPMCWACCYWIPYYTWFWPGELLICMVLSEAVLSVNHLYLVFARSANNYGKIISFDQLTMYERPYKYMYMILFVCDNCVILLQFIKCIQFSQLTSYYQHKLL